jgi:hypothetical protein
LRKQAHEAVEEAAGLALPCLDDDVRLMRATVAASRGERPIALAESEALLAAYAHARVPPLTALVALRNKGFAQAGPEGAELVTRAETLMKQRRIENPRRFARLFAPGLEEALATRKRVMTRQ